MNPSSKTSNISLVFLIIGIVIIVLSCLYYFFTKTPSNYVKTTGTIVSVKTENIKNPGKTGGYTLTYFPVISFKSGNKDYHFFDTGQYYYPNSLIGQKISVEYNPSNPSSSPRLTNDKGPLIFSIIIATLGLLISLIALPFFIKKLKTN